MAPFALPEPQGDWRVPNVCPDVEGFPPPEVVAVVLDDEPPRLVLHAAAKIMDAAATVSVLNRLLRCLNDLPPCKTCVCTYGGV